MREQHDEVAERERQHDFRGHADAEPENEQRAERDARHAIERGQERRENPVEPIVAIEKDRGGDTEDDRQQERDCDLQQRRAEMRQNLAFPEELPKRLSDADGRRHERGIRQIECHRAFPDTKKQREEQNAHDHD